MPKIQPYVQQYRKTSPQATPTDFGASNIDPGAGMRQLGKVAKDTSVMLANVERKKQNRIDVIEGVLGRKGFKFNTMTELAELGSKSDKAGADYLTQAQAIIDKNIALAADNYKGSENGRNLLRAQIAEIGGTFAQSVHKQNISAQYKAIGNELTAFSETSAKTAYNTPGTLGSVVENIKKEAIQYKGVMPQETLDTWTNDAVAQAYVSSINKLNYTGEYEAAEKLLTDARTNNIAIDADDYMRMSNRNIVGKRNDEVNKAKLTNQFQSKGLNANILNIFATQSSAFEAGTLTDEQDRGYKLAAFQYTKGYHRDPITNEMVQYTKELPPSVKRAFESRGIPVPGTGVPEDIESDRNPDKPIPPELTTWNNIHYLQGLNPAVQRTLGAYQFTEDWGEESGGGRYTRAYDSLNRRVNDLVTILQNNPKYAEGERAMLKEELALVLGLLKSPKAFRQKLISLDSDLEQRYEKAAKVVANPRTDPATSTAYFNVMQGIAHFRKQLGVPPVIRSAEELEDVAPGAEFISADGRLFRNQPSRKYREGNPDELPMGF